MALTPIFLGTSSSYVLPEDATVIGIAIACTGGAASSSIYTGADALKGVLVRLDTIAGNIFVPLKIPLKKGSTINSSSDCNGTIYFG